MRIESRFTELFGCSVPIQLAPMGGVTNPALVAAVIAGGGMGAIGTGPMPAEVLAGQLRGVRELTNGPLLVNLLVPLMQPGTLEVAAEFAQCVDFFHADPDPDLVAQVHAAGAKAGWQVGSLQAAKAAEQAGCDVIVVRGVEGGGRMYGSESLWPLLSEVLDAVSVPVLAAGGIGDGRGLAAALAAGASGVRMGTRFLASTESRVHDRYRQALIAASAADTILTDEFRVGWPDGEPSWSRVLRHSLEAARAFDGEIVGTLALGPVEMDVPRLGVPMPLTTSTGNVDAMAMYAGESVRFVRGEESAADIVRTVAAQASAVLHAAGCESPGSAR